MSNPGKRGIVPVDYAVIQARNAKAQADQIAADRLIGLAPLGLTAGAAYSQAQMQALMNQLDAVVKALQSDLQPKQA